MINALATKWRHENGYTGKCGVVVLWGREVQGWVNELRDPDHWTPGCVAITEAGACYEASGGNAQDGADYWRPIPEDRAELKPAV